MWTCCDAGRRVRQRGDMLMEALVAVLLLCILGGGMAWVATSMLGAQRDTRIQGLAVVSMRQLLRERGETLCAGPSTLPLRVGGDDLALDTQVEVACEAAAPLVEVRASGSPAITVAAPRRVSLRLPPEALGLPAGGPPLVVGTQQ